MGCAPSSPTPTADVPKQAPVPDPAPDYDAFVKANPGTPLFVTTPSARREIVYAATGSASKPEPGTPTTLLELMEHAKVRHGDSVALAVERSDAILAYDPKSGTPPPAGLPWEQWKKWTWNEYYTDVRRCARGLLRLGGERYQGVCLFGFNAPEWHITQLGANFAGFIPAGLYATDEGPIISFKVRHSNSFVVVVEDAARLAKIQAVLDELPKVKAIVVYSPAYQPPTGVTTLARKDGSTVRLLTFAELLAEGPSDGDLESKLEQIKADIKPEDCSCLIYTSGTTGFPKAVMMSHDNLVFETTAALRMSPELGSGGPDVVLSYLPLSHIAAITIDITMPLTVAAVMPGYGTTCFARSYDLKTGTLGERLRAVRPTLLFGVPRVWEKIEERMKAVGAKTKGLKRAIATWAKATSLERERNLQIGGSGVTPPKYDFYNKLVLSKIKTVLGLDRVRVCASGAAPISVSTLEYFASIGIHINETYGMSECGGAACITNNRHRLWGSVGMAFSGVEVAVLRPETDPADPTKTKYVRAKDAVDVFHPTEEEQGELCYRGRNIMMGYMANPEVEDEADIIKKNRAAIDEFGWLHSGDKGCRSTTGFFRVTGRYKELIIGAGGENIAPVPIEDRFKELCPAVSRALMIGDKRKFNVMLVTLQTEGASGEAKGNGVLTGLAKDVSPSCTTAAEAQSDAAWVKYLTDGLTKLNASRDVVVSDAFKVQKLMVLPFDFSIEGGEYTATLKFRRSFIDEKFKKSIDAMYAGTNDVVVKFVEP